jgi:hypothetical protein
MQRSERRGKTLNLRAASYEENNSAEHRLDRTEEKDLCTVDIGLPRR